MPLYDFLTLYILAGLWVLLALPAQWFRRIVQVAFGVPLNRAATAYQHVHLTLQMPL